MEMKSRISARNRKWEKESMTVFSVFITYKNSRFHLYSIPTTVSTRSWRDFPIYTHPICRDRTTWFNEPSEHKFLFHSGDRDRGLSFPFLIHSPNFRWVFPFHRIADFSDTDLITDHRSQHRSQRSMCIQPTTAPNQQTSRIHGVDLQRLVSLLHGTIPDPSRLSSPTSLADTELTCSHPSRIDLASF